MTEDIFNKYPMLYDVCCGLIVFSDPILHKHKEAKFVGVNNETLPDT